ncbi:MAG: tripartite tricarboxylate transporter permease [Deltaproteobacteria bacterium]
MSVFHNLLYGLAICLEPLNLFACFSGALLGTLVGVLPGLGPVAAISLLLPVTFQMPAAASLIMLAGIFYGAMYGGSTTSILMNIPGESASVVTCFDGYQMARKGRAGPALGISAFGSFIAGTVGVLGITLISPIIVTVALKFGPPEYVGLITLSLSMVVYLSSRSLLKAFIMTVIGLLLGTIGVDPMVGSPRFTYGITSLLNGLNIAPVVMGLFGIPEVLENVEKRFRSEIFQTKLKGLFPSRADWKRSLLPIFRGTVIGFFLGTLPGVGAIIPTFLTYSLERKLSKHPEEFGTGVIEGVAAPESANNAASTGAFIPLLTLGVPPNVVIALLYGALLVHGIQPGPLLMKQHPDVFWGVIASMYVGNGMLLVLNLPLIPLWVQILKVPYPILFPLILLFCLIGSYSVDGNPGDVLVMVIFGSIGYMMRKLRFEAAPFVLAFILGPMMEVSFRHSLVLSRGSFGIFLQRPIALVFLCIALILFGSRLITYAFKGPKKLPVESEFEDE